MNKGENAVYASTPTTLTLAGVLGDDEARSLLGYCTRLAGCGQTHLTLNVEGVVDVHREGLEALAKLRSGAVGLEVVVRGAPWIQELIDADDHAAPVHVRNG